MGNKLETECYSEDLASCGKKSTNSDRHDVKTSLISKNINIYNRRTSVRLEPEMWKSLRQIASREKCSIHDICSLIDIRKQERTSLTAAIRVFIMLYYKAASTEEGHLKAGHGHYKFMLRRARLDFEEKKKNFFSPNIYFPSESKVDNTDATNCVN